MKKRGPLGNLLEENITIHVIAIFCFIFFAFLSLDNTNLVGNLEGIIISSEFDKSLLLSSWGDQSVDLADFNVVQILHNLFDLGFIGTDVANENKSVSVFWE